jgi:hypothetical protein
MPTNFPTSVDNFTNPTANDSLNLPSHSTQHANANDAIEAIETYLLNGGQGLTHINTTTFTGVTAVNLNNVFTSTYDNYRVELNITSGSAFAGLGLRLRLSGTDSSTTYNYANPIYTAGSSSIAYQTSSSATEIQIGFLRNSTDGNAVSIDIFNPNKASFTTVLGEWADINATQYGSAFGSHKVSTAYDGFSLLGATISGTVRVYGYRNA